MPLHIICARVKGTVDFYTMADKQTMWFSIILDKSFAIRLGT